ncbi:MAG TPA: Gfo/Idh/MocA family oxidoreductase [Burkholderiales bacterium]|nr:Gfo/Idh/MocA family oxidoreductase [Burkholderiales bacterium]
MLNAAIVGLGRWGRNLVNAVQGKSANLRFVRGVAMELDSARPFGAGHGFEVTDRYEDALADPRVQAVVLATPHLLHTQQIVAAARAGKHVYCEKPLALKLADARTSVEACQAAGVVLGLGQQRRFWPSVAAVRDMVQQGALGEILHIEGHFSNEHSNNVLPDSWRDHPEESPGGGMTGAGLHVLDSMISMLGPVAKVHARMLVRKPQPAPLDSVTAMYEFANGVSGLLATVRATPLYWRLHAFGSLGSAEALGENELVLRFSGKAPERRELAPVDSLRLVLEAFADAVAGRAPYPISPAQMLATMAAFETTTRSIAEDRMLSVE